MIVVVVIGILAAIAVPLYGDSVTRSKIIDATTKLGDFRTQMEKYFMDNRTYFNGAACGATLRIRRTSPPAHNFNITCVRGAGPPETYMITATGAQRHVAAFVYTVNQANAKTSSGPGWQIYESRMLGRTQGRVLLMFRARTAGFTLVELMIGLAIAGAAAGARDAELLGLDRRRPDPQCRRVDRQRNALCAEPGGRAQQRRRVHPLHAGNRVDRAGSRSTRSTLQTGVFAEGSAQTTQTPTPAGDDDGHVSALSAGSASPTRTRASTLTEVDVNSAVAGARNLNVLVGGGASSVLGQAKQDRHQDLRSQMAGDRSEGLPGLTPGQRDMHRTCTP